MRGAYYNENDPRAAAWLRELVRRGLIAPGDVDERSICDVQPDDLRTYGQCHFFAGIGGWSLALRLAGVPDDVPVWSGSCPCQPFSPAGRGAGTDDERHLWPELHRLIAERRPAIAVGEQTASRAGLDWLAVVRDDWERCGYAVGAADLPAAGVGAPHRRQRIWWGAVDTAGGRGSVVQAARAAGSGLPMSAGRGGGGPVQRDVGAVADVPRAGLEGYAGHVYGAREPGRDGRTSVRSCADADPWARSAGMVCRDGSTRPVPLAHGLPGDVGRSGRGVATARPVHDWHARALTGYGNAIVPQVAAVFVRSLLDAASG